MKKILAIALATTMLASAGSSAEANGFNFGSLAGQILGQALRHAQGSQRPQQRYYRLAQQPSVVCHWTNGGITPGRCPPVWNPDTGQYEYR